MKDLIALILLIEGEDADLDQDQDRDRVQAITEEDIKQLSN